MPHLYHSGSLGDTSQRTHLMRILNYRLLSLHEKYLTVARNYLKQIGDARDTREVTLLFDSGAFTAWKDKEPDITVEDLAKRLRGALKLAPKFKDMYFITLDKIPGQPGTTPSAEEVSEAIRISDENHHKLSAEFGTRVLPVFHQGEPESRLLEVLDLNPEYICVSPRNDVYERYRREWSQRVHSLLPPTTRTHGLATTGSRMMLEVPWYSIDSAAIIQVAAFGKIFLPVEDDLILVPVSQQSRDRRFWGKHIETMSEKTRKIAEKYMEPYNLTWDMLRVDGGARELINAQVLVEASERPNRKVPIQQTFFAL